MPVRKLSLILFACLLLPAAALAERVAAGDGSLVVSDASGKLTLSGRGLIFGHLDHGTITVSDYKPDDTTVPSISGAKMKLSGGNVVYTGTNVRFLFPGGRYAITIEGINIDISAVGTGKLVAIGAGFIDDGSFTADGGRSQSIDFAGSVSYGKGAAVAVAARGRNG